ncbi:MAG: hypothetical protein GC134_07660 [Proteobacteria bacterium]|nr:hypothetical protein [Pseudomonadota bacterium]
MMNKSVIATAFAAACFVLTATAAYASSSGDEQLVRQKVMKLWNQPHVQQLWKDTKKNLGVIHSKADNLSEGAVSAFERQWLFHTRAFMDKYYASDIPAKLQSGDWSVRDELLYLLTGKYQAEYKQDMHDLEEEMLNAVKNGDITTDQFLALLKTLYENLDQEAPQGGVNTGQ